MRGNMKMKGILIATAFLLLMALAGSASADEASDVGHIYPSEDTPGQLEVFLVNDSGYINAFYWVNTTAWSVNASYEDTRGWENTTVGQDATAKAIQFATDNATDENNTVIVGPGTYNGSVNITNSLGNQRLNITSTDGPDETIIDGEGVTLHTSDSLGSPGWDSLVAINVSDVTFEGFTVMNSVKSADANHPNESRGIGIYGPSGGVLENIVLKDNTVTGSSAGGIQAEYSQVTVENNKVVNNTYDGFVSYNLGNGSIIKNNNLSENGPSPIASHTAVWHDSGIEVGLLTGAQVTISGNTIEDNIGNDSSTGTPSVGTGIYLRNSIDSSNTVIIESNDISGNSDLGIISKATDASGISINNNNIVGNGLLGVKNTVEGTLLNATYNYWGASDGPSYYVGNSTYGARLVGGNGDLVDNSSVDFFPYLTTKAPNGSVTTKKGDKLVVVPESGLTTDETAQVYVFVRDYVTYGENITYTNCSLTNSSVNIYDHTEKAANVGNLTDPFVFDVNTSETGIYTLDAYDTYPDNGQLYGGSGDQYFAPVLDGVNVYSEDGELTANNADSEIIYVQLTDGSGNNVAKKDVNISWSYEGIDATGADVIDEETSTNSSGMASTTVTTATNSGETIEVTGIAEEGGSTWTDSVTVDTVAGAVNNSTSKLYVNNTGANEATVNTSVDVDVQLYDNSSNPVEGITVKLSANTSAEFGDSSPISNSNGWANTTVTLPDTAGVTMIRAITGEGNTSLSPPELNQTVNVTTVPAAVSQVSVSPSKNIGIPNVPGKSKNITVQLQDQYGNDNNSAADILVTTDNEALGNMTYAGTTTNNSLWVNITGSDNFTYNVNSTEAAEATLTLNVTTYGFTDTVNVTTSGPTGLKVLVNNTLPLVGDTVMATAQLQGQAGDIAISGKSITFTLENPNDNLVNTFTDTTDSEGKVTWNISQSTLGTYTFKAINASLGISDTNTTTYVGNATQITIAVNDTSPQVNDTIAVYAIFKDANGYNSSSVHGDYVEFLANDSLFANNSISDAVASATYTPSSSGDLALDVFYTNESNPYWNGTIESASKTITVEAKVTVESVSVTPSSKTVKVGDYYQFTAGATWSDGNTTTVTDKADWSVSNATVGSVDAGNFTANATGTTFVNATYEGYTDSAKVTVITEIANVSLVNFTMPTEGVAPFKPTVTVNLTNTGGVAGDYNVTLWLEGSVMCHNVTTVPANATETVEFVTPHKVPAGTYNVSVGNETTPIFQKTLTVTKPALFNLSNLNVSPTQIVANETVNASVDVTNNGGTAGTYEAWVWLGGQTCTQCHASEELPIKHCKLGSEKVEPGETETIENTTHPIPFIWQGVSEVEISVYVGNETAPAIGPQNITVKQKANVSVDSFDVEPSTVNVSEPFKLNATVKNTGGVEGPIDLSFKKENATTGAREVFDSKTVSVDAGETVYVESSSTSYANAGNYSVSVNDLSPKTVTVQRVCTANEQLVKKYYTEYNCAANLTKDDVVTAVTNAVKKYFRTTNKTKKQQIVDDVTHLVKIYFHL